MSSARGSYRKGEREHKRKRGRAVKSWRSVCAELFHCNSRSSWSLRVHPGLYYFIFRGTAARGDNRNYTYVFKVKQPLAGRRETLIRHDTNLPDFIFADGPQRPESLIPKWSASNPNFFERTKIWISPSGIGRNFENFVRKHLVLLSRKLSH